jgi:hypothetical protein
MYQFGKSGLGESHKVNEAKYPSKTHTHTQFHNFSFDDRVVVKLGSQYDFVKQACSERPSYMALAKWSNELG